MISITLATALVVNVLCVVSVLVGYLPATLHIPREFPGNSRGTGKFPRFGWEPLPQNVPVIQGEPSMLNQSHKLVPGERSVGSSFFENLVPPGGRKR